MWMHEAVLSNTHNNPGKTVTVTKGEKASVTKLEETGVRRQLEKVQWEWKPLRGYTNNGQIYICTWIVFNSVMTKISIKRSADWKCKFSPRLLMDFWETPSAIWASIVSCPWYWNSKHIGEVFFNSYYVSVYYNYLFYMCEGCREALQNSHKNNLRVYWSPAWLLHLKSFRAQVKLILASSKYACFLALLTHKREFSEWAFRVLVGVYDCLWSAILLIFSINRQMSVELTF